MTPMTPLVSDAGPEALEALGDAVAPSGPGGFFDAALAGRCQRLVRHDGVVLPLAVQRWHDDADADDLWIVERCAGATLDLGCGPGRLVVALADRGVPVLGVDVSTQAVQRCLERGAAVLHRDAFERLPGEGRWMHVVLADGNIGIGGDPVALLMRCRELLTDGGTVLVELEPGAGLWRGQAYLESTMADGHASSPWFPWAVLGPHSVDQIALDAGMAVVARTEGERCFAVLASG